MADLGSIGSAGLLMNGNANSPSGGANSAITRVVAPISVVYRQNVVPSITAVNLELLTLPPIATVVGS